MSSNFTEAMQWEVRFWDQVEKVNGCHLWRGREDNGEIELWDGKITDLQRFAYCLYFNSVPDKYDIKPLCSNNLCIRREHLIVYSKENTKDLWQIDFRLRDAHKRFWVKVKGPRTNGVCWLWKGAVLTSGYGVFKPGKDIAIRATTSHRLAYEMEVGEIPPGYDVQQSCGEKLCVNPAHLFTEPHGSSSKIKVRSWSSKLAREDILALIDVKDIDSCWLWKGPKIVNNYLSNKKYRTNAIKLAYRALGHETRDGEIIKQTCGTDTCCNPSHIKVYYPKEVRIKNFIEAIDISGDHWISRKIENDKIRTINPHFTLNGSYAGLYDTAYLYLVGPLPLEHKAYPGCGGIYCINPDHLKTATNKNADNIITSLRFWLSVRKTDKCWEWHGKITVDGYGMFCSSLFAGKRKGFLAHRYSYLLSYGHIPDGKIIRHSCDNRTCVRPDHLLVGTPADNAKDRISRNRNISSIKVDNKTIKCSYKSIVNARRIYRNFVKSIARRLGVHYYTAKYIIEASNEDIYKSLQN